MRLNTKNVSWNLFGGAWTGLLVVLATPWYVSSVGLSGYGVVGLWLMLQVMMGLLDMGIGAALIKGLASAPQGNSGATIRRDLLRTLELLYWGIALVLMLALVASSDWISHRWLKAGTLPAHSLSTAMLLMAVSLGLQFPGALYANGLAGLQAHAHMNAMQVAGNTLRYGAGAAVLLWRADIVWFFGVQIGVAAAQTVATRSLTWHLLSTPGAEAPRFRRAVLAQIRNFSAGMALTAVCAVLLASADRIVLSRMVSMEALGQYALAFAGAGLLQLGIQPFYRTFFPRYAELLSLNDHVALRREYFQGCRMMAMLLLPLGLVGFVFAPELLHAWLGRHDETLANTFRLLLLGITCSGLCWLPAAFQQAHGWTRLHTQMMVGSVLIGVPLIVMAVPAFGIAGATAVWLVHGLSDLTLGLWLMHRRLLRGDLLHWYRTVLTLPLLTAGPLAAAAVWLMPDELGRWSGLAWAAATGLLACGSAFAAQQYMAERSDRTI
ncbi:lipopolysaccharide biosynthesis protein [Roseateles sp.]|uniref:lipopolysaccharide biosynthesis protein n=1 Tax=Roseateles sp. TaxID=1971397 RepID=UPI003BA83E57